MLPKFTVVRTLTFEISLLAVNKLTDFLRFILHSSGTQFSQPKNDIEQLPTGDTSSTSTSSQNSTITFIRAIDSPSRLVCYTKLNCYKQLITLCCNFVIRYFALLQLGAAYINYLSSYLVQPIRLVSYWLLKVLEMFYQWEVGCCNTGT